MLVERSDTSRGAYPRAAFRTVFAVLHCILRLLSGGGYYKDCGYKLPEEGRHTLHAAKNNFSEPSVSRLLIALL